MSTLRFSLHKKTLSVNSRDGAFTQKLSFEAKLPRQHSLSTHDGKQVTTGYVEFVFENPEYETATIHFIDAIEDIDTGSIDPPSISFYANVTPDVFTLMRDSAPNALLTLRLDTELMGAIQFNDPMGYEKVWDTSRQNPAVVESYEIKLTSADVESIKSHD